MVGLRSNLASVLSAARLALASGDFEAASALEREYTALERAYSERLGEELLASQDTEFSVSPVNDVSFGSWSDGIGVVAGILGSELDHSDRAPNASSAAGERQAIAQSALREPVDDGHYLSSSTGKRFYLWPISAGPHPRSMPIARTPPAQSVAEIGLFYLEVV